MSKELRRKRSVRFAIRDGGGARRTIPSRPTAPTSGHCSRPRAALAQGRANRRRSRRTGSPSQTMARVAAHSGAWWQARKRAHARLGRLSCWWRETRRTGRRASSQPHRIPLHLERVPCDSCARKQAFPLRRRPMNESPAGAARLGGEGRRELAERSEVFEMSRSRAGREQGEPAQCGRLAEVGRVRGTSKSLAGRRSTYRTSNRRVQGRMARRVPRVGTGTNSRSGSPSLLCQRTIMACKYTQRTRAHRSPVS